MEEKGLMLWIFTVCWILAWFLTLGVYGLSLLTEPDYDEDILDEEFFPTSKESEIVKVQNVGYSRNYTMQGKRPVRSLPVGQPVLPHFGDEDTLESIYDESVGKVSCKKTGIPTKPIEKVDSLWENIDVKDIIVKGKKSSSKNQKPFDSVEVSGDGVKFAGSSKKSRRMKAIRVRDKNSGEVLGVFIMKK